MKEISKEVRLEYQNDIGQYGVQTFYELTNKHDRIKKALLCCSMIWFCLTFFLSLTLGKGFELVDFVYIILAIAIVSICTYLVILQDSKLSKYSMNCVFLTEIIELENFHYVTACIGIDEDLKRYFILKSYDKNNNLLRQSEIEIPIGYEFSNQDVASLTVTNTNWVLVFPKNKINFGTF